MTSKKINNHQEEDDYCDGRPIERGEHGRLCGLPFSYPALQEGDFLSLMMFDKHNMLNRLSAYKHFFASCTVSEMINKLCKELDQNVIDYQSFNNYTFVVFEDCMINLLIHDNEHNGEPYNVNAFFYAKNEVFDKLFGKFNVIEWMPDQIDQPYITWAIQTPQGIKTNRLKASANKKSVKDVFYPSIEDGIDNFYEEYEASDSPVLVILGPPGMGKTSFIRNYIYKYHKEALITYDEKLMETDEFFLYYLEHDHDLLLLEDFDIFLKSREDDDNKIMNKFLNLAEGIVDISQKKIIVTANLDKRVIDEALIRPGRCFRVVEMERYTERQAEAVLAEMGLTFDGSCDNVSLAELFSNKRRIEGRSSVGFTKLRSA